MAIRLSRSPEASFEEMMASSRSSNSTNTKENVKIDKVASTWRAPPAFPASLSWRQSPFPCLASSTLPPAPGSVLPPGWKRSSRVTLAPFHLHLPSVGAQHNLKVRESSANIIPPPSSVHQPVFESFLTFSGPQLSTRPPPASWPCLICTWEDSKLDHIILQTCQRWWSATF